MEGVAWFTHKFIMHGFLWVIHEDHHRPHKGYFEKNDLFTVFFSLVAFFLFFFGLLWEIYPMFSAGLGMSFYGIFYTIFHDILFHKRIKIKAPKWRYLKRIINAHRTHHAGRDTQRNAKAYGFLFASKKYDNFPST